MPWRAWEAERALVGERASRASFVAAAAKALQSARPRIGTAFKVELAKRTIVRVLQEAAG